MKRRACSICGTSLPRLELVSDEGVNHVTGEHYFTCRKCLLEAAAQANLVLAYKRLQILGAAPKRVRVKTKSELS